MMLLETVECFVENGAIIATGRVSTNGNFELVQYLLDHGVDVMTILLPALEQGHIETIQYMIERHTPTNISSFLFPMMPLSKAIKCEDEDDDKD